MSSLVELSDGGVASGGHDRKLIAWGGTSLGVTNAALGGGGGGGGGGGNGGSGGKNNSHRHLIFCGTDADAADSSSSSSSSSLPNPADAISPPAAPETGGASAISTSGIVPPPFVAKTWTRRVRNYPTGFFKKVSKCQIERTVMGGATSLPM